jgi:hypothetical protein
MEASGFRALFFLISLLNVEVEEKNVSTKFKKLEFLLQWYYPDLMTEESQTILIGIGETEDPLPDYPRNTRFWLFAGVCEICGCGGREIEIFSDKIALKCESCGQVRMTLIDAADYFEVSYVYWCKRAKFASDIVEISQEAINGIEKLIESFDDFEIPRWAVVIVGGVCEKKACCVNYECRYNAVKGGDLK